MTCGSGSAAELKLTPVSFCTVPLLSQQSIVLCYVSLFLFQKETTLDQETHSWTSSVVCVLSCCVVSNCVQSMDSSPPGSSVHGISQARILEWVAISFSRGCSQPRNWTPISCISRLILFHWTTREAHVNCTSVEKEIYHRNQSRGKKSKGKKNFCWALIILIRS